MSTHNYNYKEKQEDHDKEYQEGYYEEDEYYEEEEDYDDYYDEYDRYEEKLFPSSIGKSKGSSSNKKNIIPKTAAKTISKPPSKVPSVKKQTEEKKEKVQKELEFHDKVCDKILECFEKAPDLLSFDKIILDEKDKYEYILITPLHNQYLTIKENDKIIKLIKENPHYDKLKEFICVGKYYYVEQNISLY